MNITLKKTLRVTGIVIGSLIVVSLLAFALFAQIPLIGAGLVVAIAAADLDRSTAQYALIVLLGCAAPLSSVRLAALRSLVKLARTLGFVPWILDVELPPNQTRSAVLLVRVPSEGVEPPSKPDQEHIGNVVEQLIF